MQLRTLTLDELHSAYALVRTRYDIDEQHFEDRIYEMRKENYIMVGAFEQDELVAYAGVAPTSSLAYGRSLYIHDIIVANGYDFDKYEAHLLLYLKDIAKIYGCEQLLFAQEAPLRIAI